ncbi:hypothetical protein BGZ63DRAFT_464790 [Mariannaea sp. PMI_226]|nr:hypothetical protein BGZ63DRAFT_464790 [Mariannaea sp. PMI_226]
MVLGDANGVKLQTRPLLEPLVVRPSDSRSALLVQQCEPSLEDVFLYFIGPTGRGVYNLHASSEIKTYGAIGAVIIHDYWATTKDSKPEALFLRLGTGSTDARWYATRAGGAGHEWLWRITWTTPRVLSELGKDTKDGAVPIDLVAVPLEHHLCGHPLSRPVFRKLGLNEQLG